MNLLPGTHRNDIGMGQALGEGELPGGAHRAPSIRLMFHHLDRNDEPLPHGHVDRAKRTLRGGRESNQAPGG